MYTLKKMNVVKVVETEYAAKKLLSKGFMLQKPHNNNDKETVIVTETIQKQDNCNNNDTSTNDIVNLSAESKVNINKTQTKTETETEITENLVDEDGFDYSELRVAELKKVAEEKGLEIKKGMKKEEILHLLQGV